MGQRSGEQRRVGELISDTRFERSERFIAAARHVAPKRLVNERVEAAGPNAPTTASARRRAPIRPS